MTRLYYVLVLISLSTTVAGQINLPQGQPIGVGANQTLQNTGVVTLSGFGGSSLATAYAALGAGQELWVDVPATLSTSFTMSTSSTTIRCMPGGSITFSGSTTQWLISATNIRVYNCLIFGQGINFGTVSGPIQIGALGTDARGLVWEENSINGFPSSGTSVVHVVNCSHCRFSDNKAGDLGQGTPIAITGATTAAPASGSNLRTYTFTTGNTQGMVLGNTVIVSGVAQADWDMTCTTTAVVTNTSFSCQGFKVPATYTSGGGQAQFTGNAETDYFFDNTVNGLTVTDIQFDHNDIGDLQVHASCSAGTPCQIMNFHQTNNKFHPGMNSK